MKTVMAVVAVMALSCGLVCAQGAGKPAEKAAPVKKEAPAKKAKIEKATGEVVSVDAAASKLSVKEKKAAKDFVLTAETKIVKGGKTITLAEMTVGEKVTVSYEGTLVKEVKVHEPAKKAEPKKSEGKKEGKKAGK